MGRRSLLVATAGWLAALTPAEPGLAAEAPPRVAELVLQLDSADVQVRGHAVLQLGEFDAEAAPAIGRLIELLEDGAFGSGTSDLGNRIGTDAAWALARIGDPTYQPLVDRLTHSRAAARGAAASALGTLGDRRATAPLTKRLRDADGEVREAAVYALYTLGDAAAFDALADFLEAGADGVGHEMMFRALSRCDRQRGRATLLRHATHRDRGVREAAFAVMAENRDPQTVDALLAGLKDPYIHAQGTAARALEWIVALRGMGPAEEAFAMKDAYHGVRDQALYALMKAEHPRRGELLVEALADESNEVQSSALYWLGQEPVAEALEPLLNLVANDDYNGIRAKAAQVLGAQGDRRAVAGLIGALGDETPLVRTCAAQSLGALGDAAAVEALIARLRDGDESTQGAAALALGAIGGRPAAAALVETLQRGASADLRQSAAWALGSVDGQTAVDALFAALEMDDDPSVRAAAADSLAKRSEATVAKRLEHLTKSSRARVRDDAQSALAMLKAREGNADAAPPVEPADKP